VAARLLERLGYRVDVVPNGREAVEAHARARYAAILMDCQMPEFDGFEATAVIRAVEGAERHTPIIALTAAAMQGDRERCLTAGMDDYITKPIQVEALATLLRRWVCPAADGSVSAEGPTLPPLDDEILGRLSDPALGGDPEFLSELIELFLDETPARLAELRQAAAAEDATGLTTAAHGLKGSAASLGARGICELCGALERLGRSGSTRGAAALIDLLREELERVRTALRERQAQPLEAA